MKLTCWLLLLGFMQQAMAQSMEARELHMNRATGNISIDGMLDDDGWKDVEEETGFWQHSPEDQIPAAVRTVVKMTYDDNGIYVCATMYDDNGQLNASLKRDQGPSSDLFTVVFDPTGQKTNGFAFGVSALNAQTETTISVNRGDESWDNRWRSAAHVSADRWTTEIFIPFASLRFKTDVNEWGVNFLREEKGRNERYVWSPVPRQFRELDLGYCGRMIWDEAQKRKGANIALIPYVTSRLDNQNSDTKVTADIGGDAKIGITPGLNLDLTVNPDFSQVDIDQFQTNLTRFSIFFPERRQFFLENADLFSDYGENRNQPFYSRRIGLDPNGTTVPILYGARLSGNVTEKMRIGAMNMHSRTTDEARGQNFTAISSQYRFGLRSSIKGLFLNRQAYDESEVIKGDYGRNYGGELNLSTNDGKWLGKAGFLKSAKQGITTRNNHLYGRFEYNGERFRTFLFIQQLGRDYYADMGFNARVFNYDPINDIFVRIGYTQVGNMVNYYIYPASDKVNYHWSGIENFVFINEGNDLNDWYTRFRHFIFFQNSSELRFRLNHHYRELIFPFNLTDTPLPADEYDNWEFNIDYRSDSRKDFNYTIFSVYGEFFNGTKFTNKIDVNFRRQPWGVFGIGFENNRINLPEPYGDLDITLLSASLEFNFSTNMFWTTYAQYNTQAERMNFNSRLQWRYAPMSDLFLVYTDNYRTFDGLSPQGRSLVLKVNYWLGL